MSTADKNLSHYDKNLIPNAKNFRFGIVVSEWNGDITEPMLQGAIDALIDNLDSSKQKIQDLLLDPVTEEIEYSDGIRYSDFLLLVQSRGSFKKTFEDIMFSTKVVITNKDEFIDFVTKLSNEGFGEMALGYLDASSQLFGNDQEILALYHVVSGK